MLPASVTVINQKFDNIKSIQSSGEDIFVFEQLNESAEKEVSVTASLSSKEVKAFNPASFNYAYIQFASSDSDYVSFIYCDDENVQNICTIKSASEEVSANSVFDRSETVSSLRSDGDGHFTYLKAVYTEDENAVYLEWADNETLQSVRSVNLTDVLEYPESASVIEAFACPDGSAYIYAADYKPNYEVDSYIYKIDSEGRLVYSVQNFGETEGHFSGMYPAENGNISVCITEDYVAYTVLELAAENGEILNTNNITVPKNSRMLSSLQFPGYDFSYISPSGLEGYSFGKGSSEVLLTFGQDLDPALKDSFTASCAGDSVYMYTIGTVEADSRVTKFDGEGNSIFTSQLKTEYGYASDYCVAPDGSVVFAETYDPGAGVETESGLNNAYIFHVLDSSGNPKSSYKIDEIDKLGDAVIQSMSFSSDGNIYMLFQKFNGGSLDMNSMNLDTVVYVAGRDGDVKAVFSGSDAGVFFTSLMVSEDSAEAACLDAEGNTTVMAFDAEKKTMETKYAVALDDSAYIVSGRGGYDLVYCFNNGLAGYRTADESSTDIVDFTGLVSGVNDIHVMSDSKILCSTYDSETGESGVSIINIG